MIIAACGGRVGIAPGDKVWGTLNGIIQRLGNPADVTFVEGGAVGYDRLCGRWALARGYKHDPVPIDEKLDGDDERAPKRRNERMLRDHGPIEVLVGFPGGPGTRHMMLIAYAAGVRVLDVEFTDDGGVQVHEWPREVKV